MSIAAERGFRRRIRDAKMDAQFGAGAQETSLRRRRMSVPESLENPSYQNTQDWTGGMGISPSGRFRVIEEPRDRQKPFSREGIRRDWARMLIWTAGIVMAVILLVQLITLGTTDTRIQKYGMKIETAQKYNWEQRDRLALLDGDITVCTKAVEMNLISSNGAPTIELTAPTGARMTLVESQPDAETGEADVRASLRTGD